MKATTLYDFLQSRLGRDLKDGTGRQLYAFRDAFSDHITLVRDGDVLSLWWIFPDGEVWEVRYGKPYRKIAVGRKGVVYSHSLEVLDPSDGVGFVIEKQG